MKTYTLPLLAGIAVMATIGAAQAGEPMALSERQMDQVFAGDTIVVRADVLASLLTSLAQLQQSGSLPISVLDVQALLNGLPMGQVTAAGGTIVVTTGDSITFTITSTPAFTNTSTPAFTITSTRVSPTPIAAF